MPIGLLNLEDSAGPFVEPVINGLVTPARVETINVFASIRRIELLVVSAT